MKQIIKHPALSITLYLLVLPLLADAQTLMYEDSHALINDYAASSGSSHKFWPGTIYVDQTLEEGPLESEELEYAIRRAIWTRGERDFSADRLKPVTVIPQHVLKAIERNCTPVATDGVVLVRMEDWNTIIEWVNETRLQE